MQLFIHFIFSEYSNTDKMTMNLTNCDFPAGLVTLLTGGDETQKGSETFCNHPYHAISKIKNTKYMVL